MSYFSKFPLTKRNDGQSVVDITRKAKLKVSNSRSFEFKMSKELGMIVRQSRGYYWMVKRLSDGQNLLILERDMEVVSEAR